MGWLSVCLVGVLLTSAKAMPVEEELDVADQEDMTELLTRLFVSAREGRDLEMEIDNAIEEDEGENKAIEGAILETNTQEISRFNNYIDAIYRRMNAALRAKLMDPMVLNLEQKGKKESSDKKNSNKRVGREAGESEDSKIAETEEEEQNQQEMEHRAGKPKKGGNKNKNKKGKENSNENKEKNKNKAEKREQKNKERTESKEEKKATAKQKRKEVKQKKKENEKAKKQKEKAKAAKAAKKEAKVAKAAKKAAKAAKAERKAAKAAGKNDDDEQTRQSRSSDHSKKHGQHHNKKKSGKTTKKDSNGNKKDKKERKSKKEHGKDKNENKKAKVKGPKGKDRDNKESVKESKVMGSLAGIATLRRSGDVTVQDDENHKVVTSSFTVGPLQLEVSKTFGQGKSRTVKTAKATTDVMSGTMILKVKPDGSAHVKKVIFSKPKRVDVKGSLSDNKPRSISYLKNSVNRMRPIAAQKILKTARLVLKAPKTVKQ